MWKIGRINACGKKHAPLKWELKTNVGNNRLYYIHSGVGGYVHKKKHVEFAPNTLYYIPYTADFTPWSHEEEPILHTYADFELIPPILTDEILTMKLDPKTAKGALGTFEAISSACTQKELLIREMTESNPARQLLSASILYLTDLVSKHNGIAPIQDEVILEVLSILHAKLSEPITISEIARLCHRDEDALIRRFTKVMGITPYAYLKDLRLRQALILRDEGRSWQKIAEEVGYKDAASLLHALGERKK
ncbi:MAG: helix-turn-helix transcriptional regulator [Clostridia bacterium]|nr:helix-turn-helix transcriptional regulator [Clostridia bacterium]